MKCNDCRFYKERHHDYNGWCRAHPPLWDKKFEVCNFPTVMAEYWCGEFETCDVVSLPEPQFDAEKVKELIGNLMGSVYYKATINDWLTESQKRAAEIVEGDKSALLSELGIE